MIRKFVLSATVLMMASGAFAKGRERTREEGRDESRAGVSSSAKTTADANTIALRQAVAGEAVQGSDVGGILQDLVLNPQSKGIDEAAQPKVDELADRVAAHRKQGEPIDASVDEALNEMGISKDELKEKCK